MNGKFISGFLPASQRTNCSTIQKKRVKLEVKEYCCNGSVDAPCLLPSSYVFLKPKVIGKANSAAGDKKRIVAERSDNYKKAQKAFEDENYKQADNGMEFRAGGRATKAYPNKEDASWWLDNGPKMGDFWVQFRHDSGYQMYHLPDGAPAIETELNVEIGGVNMKGFLDRLMVAPTGELVVVDIKTSSKAPMTYTQLGTYAIMTEKLLGIRPTLGSYFMARTGEFKRNDPRGS